MQKVGHPLSVRVFYAILIIGISSWIRIIAASVIPAYATPDSIGYAHIGQDILRSPTLKTIFNPYRTPGYSLFTAFMQAAAGRQNDEIDAPASAVTRNWISAVQSALSVSSIVFLFIALSSLRIPLVFSFLFCLIQSVNPMLFIWERAVLTEGISIPLTTICLALAIMVLNSKNRLPLYLLTGVCVLQFLIRPAFMLAPIGLFSILLVAKRQIRSRLIIALCFVVTMITPAVYATLVETQYGVFEIQTTSPISMFGKIMYEQIPIDAAATFEPLYSQVTRFNSTGLRKDSFVFFSYFQIASYNQPSYLRMLNKFNRTVIRSQLGRYLLSFPKRIPAHFLDTADYEPFMNIQHPAAGTLKPLYGVARGMQIILFGFLFFFPVALVRFMKNRSDTSEKAMLLAGSFGAVQMLTILSVQSYTVSRYTAAHLIPLSLFSLYWSGRLFIRCVRMVPAMKNIG